MPSLHYNQRSVHTHEEEHWFCHTDIPGTQVQANHSYKIAKVDVRNSIIIVITQIKSDDTDLRTNKTPTRTIAQPKTVSALQVAKPQ